MTKRVLKNTPADAIIAAVYYSGEQAERHRDWLESFGWFAETQEVTVFRNFDEALKEVSIVETPDAKLQDP